MWHHSLVDRTCTIVACGNSLRGYDGPLLGDRLFVNHSWKYFDYDNNPEVRSSVICFDKIDHKVANRDGLDKEWPYIHTWKKHGGRYLPFKGVLGKTYPNCTNHNTSVAMALNIAYHWNYKQVYVLGADGWVDEYYHFYSKEPVPDERQRRKLLLPLRGRPGGSGGMNGKILKTAQACEAEGLRVCFVQSKIREQITLEEYAKFEPH